MALAAVLPVRVCVCRLMCNVSWDAVVAARVMLFSLYEYLLSEALTRPEDIRVTTKISDGCATLLLCGVCVCAWCEPRPPHVLTVQRHATMKSHGPYLSLRRLRTMMRVSRVAEALSTPCCLPTE